MIATWSTLFVFTFVILFGKFWLPMDRSVWCPLSSEPIHYKNPDTNNDPCYHHRIPFLLGLNLFQMELCQRMLLSILLGSAIGWERNKRDRPAGIRTMALVSLGSSLFSFCGQFAFRGSTQSWDAARVSAAIPSGVSFLGSALIWKHSVGTKNEVHGLTTAASVWLSASVGIGAAGSVPLVSVYCVLLVIFVLRLGPRMMLALEEDAWEEEKSTTGSMSDRRTRLMKAPPPPSPGGPSSSLTATHPFVKRSLKRRSSRTTFHGD